MRHSVETYDKFFHANVLLQANSDKNKNSILKCMCVFSYLKAKRMQEVKQMTLFCG